MNGTGAVGLATVVGSAKLGDSALGGEGDTEDKNGFCAGLVEAAAGNGGGPFEATGAAIGNGGGPLRTGAATGTATSGAATDTAAAAGFAGGDTTAAAGAAGEACKAMGVVVGLGRWGGAAGFTGRGLTGRG